MALVRRVRFNRADGWLLAGALVLAGAAFGLLRITDALVAPPRPRISRSARPVIGLVLRSDPSGLEVLAAVTPAREAGIRAGDRLVSVDGRPVTSPADVTRLVEEASPGHALRIEARRQDGTAEAVLVDVEPRLRPVSPADEDLPYETVSLRAPWGGTLRGWFVPAAPPPGGGRVPAIAWGHGNASDRRQWLWSARDVHEAGIAQLLFDFGGRGDSDGDVVTLGERESGDLTAALDWLAARPEIDPAKLALGGKSMGGAAAILAAARDPRVRALVVDSAFADLSELVDRTLEARHLPPSLVRPLVFRVAGWRARFDPSSLKPVEAMAKVRVPVLLFHGEADANVPVSHAEALAAAAAGHCTLVRLPGLDHNSPRPAEAASRIATFLARILE